MGMTEEQIKRIVLEALEEIAGGEPLGAAVSRPAPSTAAVSGSAGRAGGGHPGAGRPTTGAVTAASSTAYPKVITQIEVEAAAAAGRHSMAIPAGTLVTPLARDLAAERGIQITIGAPANPTAQAGCALGSSYCVECGACVQPAFYERRPWPLAQDLDSLIQRIQTFTLQVWPEEPADVRALRDVWKPPMGTLPCVFYANANLFWSGENIQVARELAKNGALPVEHLNRHLAASLNRHAARLSKWGFGETIGLMKDVISFLEQGGAGDFRSFAYLCEQLMIALDRVQSWTDRMIPWNDLDSGVRLRPLM